MIYKTCPDCGAHLDPDEKCDCLTYEDESDIQQEALKLPLQMSCRDGFFAKQADNAN